MSDLAPPSLAADPDSSLLSSPPSGAILQRPAPATVSAERLARASGQTPAETRRGSRLLAVNLATTIFVSAFLLFQVQPLISKYILPWFGGSPAVWTTCMLFFQVTLFAGYAYAHLLTRLPAKWQVIVHGTLLAAAIVAMFPTIAPGVHWKPIDSAHPTARIVLLLAATVGLPYFVLSTTGPLVQAWFARVWPERSPYRLYSLSNAGSLLALVTYPFLFEPAFASDTQAAMWSVTFGLFVILCGVAAAWVFKLPAAARAAVSQSDAAATGEVSTMRRLLWVGLPACASLMLLATTNYVCQDIAVIPFLWVVPLALYLLTFIICFDHSRWYRPVPMAIAATVLLILSAGAADDLAGVLGARISFIVELCLYFGTMFAACMVCHGELVRLRPAARRLTEYYMLISAGGAVGGIFVSLVAPYLFRTHFEWTLALAVSMAVALAVWVPRLSRLLAGPSAARWWWAGGFASVGLGIPAVLGGAYWLTDSAKLSSDAIYRGRNFYGTVAVLETDRGTDLHHRTFVSGSTRHGKQYAAPEKRNIPISYYDPNTGVGRALKFFQDRPDTRVGVVGMGVGVSATYARPGHYYRFYEINDQVVDIANEQFTFLKDCQARYDIVVADARLALERELAAGEPQHFHVLTLDAFTGDAPPMHLLTAEAFDLYLQHLEPDGIIVVNITNRYIDLAPVIKRIAKEYDLGVTRVMMTPYEGEKLLYRTDFMVLTRNQEFLAATPPVLMQEYLQPDYEVPLWTDKYSNLFSILKR